MSDKMTEINVVKERLDTLVRNGNFNVKRRLQKGDRVYLSRREGLFYEIDDPEIYRQVLGDVPSGFLPYPAIADHFVDYRKFESPEKKLREFFNGCKVMPFSRVVNEKIGFCLEKSILASLAMQNHKEIDFYLIFGGNLDNGEPGNHAFNVGCTENQENLLVDINKPYERIEGTTRIKTPFIVPILGMENDWFITPEELSDKRKYSISPLLT